MELRYTGMIKRWGDLSSWQKYGTQPAEKAAAICDLLIQLVETGTVRRLSETQEGLLLGFEINTGYTAEDGFFFVHCLDLHTVSLDPDWAPRLITDLDHYFMERVEVNGLSFWDRYRPTLPRK